MNIDKRPWSPFKEFQRIYIQGCSGCSFEESDGELFNHCDECCKKLAELIQKGEAHPLVEYHEHLVNELKRRKFLPESHK